MTAIKGVILRVDKKIAKIQQEIDKNTPTFCQKHSDYIFASGRSGSSPLKHLLNFRWNLI